MENKWCPLCGGVGHYFSYVVLRDVPCVCHIPQRPIAPQNEFSIIDKNLKKIAKQLDDQRPIAPESQNTKPWEGVFSPETEAGIRRVIAMGERLMEGKKESETAIHNAAVDGCVGAIKECDRFTGHPGDMIYLDEAIAALQALKK